MANMQQYYDALRAADAAGDVEGARKLAAYIQSQPTEQAPVQPAFAPRAPYQPTAVPEPESRTEYSAKQFMGRLADVGGSLVSGAAELGHYAGYKAAELASAHEREAIPLDVPLGPGTQSTLSKQVAPRKSDFGVNYGGIKTEDLSPAASVLTDIAQSGKTAGDKGGVWATEREATTTHAITDALAAGDVGGAVDAVGNFIIDGLPALAGDITAFGTSPLAYTVSWIDQIAQDRAKADGREGQLNSSDLAVGAVAAPVMALVEKLSFPVAKEFLRTGKLPAELVNSAAAGEVKGLIRRVIDGGFTGFLKEGGKEATQEVVEYLASNLETKTGVSASDAFHSALGGFLLGGPPGSVSGAAQALPTPQSDDTTDTLAAERAAVDAHGGEAEAEIEAPPPEAIPTAPAPGPAPTDTAVPPPAAASGTGPAAGASAIPEDAQAAADALARSEVDAITEAQRRWAERDAAQEAAPVPLVPEGAEAAQEAPGAAVPPEPGAETATAAPEAPVAPTEPRAPAGTPQRVLQDAEKALADLAAFRETTKAALPDRTGLPGRPVAVTGEMLSAADAAWTSMKDFAGKLEQAGYDVSTLVEALKRAAGNKIEGGWVAEGTPISGRVGNKDNSNRTPPGGWQKTLDRFYDEVSAAVSSLRAQPTPVPGKPNTKAAPKTQPVIGKKGVWASANAKKYAEDHDLTPEQVRELAGIAAKAPIKKSDVEAARKARGTQAVREGQGHADTELVPTDSTLSAVPQGDGRQEVVAEGSDVAGQVERQEPEAADDSDPAELDGQGEGTAEEAGPTTEGTATEDAADADAATEGAPELRRIAAMRAEIRDLEQRVKVMAKSNPRRAKLQARAEALKEALADYLTDYAEKGEFDPGVDLEELARRKQVKESEGKAEEEAARITEAAEKAKAAKPVVVTSRKDRAKAVRDRQRKKTEKPVEKPVEKEPKEKKKAEPKVEPAPPRAPERKGNYRGAYASPAAYELAEANGLTWKDIKPDLMKSGGKINIKQVRDAIAKKEEAAKQEAIADRLDGKEGSIVLGAEESQELFERTYEQVLKGVSTTKLDMDASLTGFNEAIAEEVITKRVEAGVFLKEQLAQPGPTVAQSSRAYLEGLRKRLDKRDPLSITLDVLLRNWSQDIPLVMHGGLTPGRLGQFTAEFLGESEGGYQHYIELNESITPDKLAWALVHEAVHAVVNTRMHSGHPAAVELEAIRQALREHLFFMGRHNDYYGMSDARELVAEAATNLEFQALLMRIPDPGASPESARTLWDRFVDAVANILGMDRTERTMLDRVMRLTEDLIQDTSANEASYRGFLAEGARALDPRQLRPGREQRRRPVVILNGNRAADALTAKQIIDEIDRLYIEQQALSKALDPEVGARKFRKDFLRSDRFKKMSDAEQDAFVKSAEYKAIADQATAYGKAEAEKASFRLSEVTQRIKELNRQLTRMETGAALGGQHRTNDQTATPAFRNWFGDSKVVDANGEPLVVYHGTVGNFESFERGSESIFRYGGNDSGGFFFTTVPEVADYYTEGVRGVEPGGNIVPVFLSVQNPAIIPDNLRLAEQAVLLREAEEQGYDGARIGTGEWVVFRPEQIKSAIGNRGTYSPTDSIILNAQHRTNSQAATKLDQIAQRALKEVTSRTRESTGIDTQEIFKRVPTRVRHGFTTLDQLVRQFADRFKSGSRNLLREYHNISRKKVRIARRLQQTAERLNQSWRELERSKPKEVQALGELMRDATISEINADLAFYNPANKHLWHKLPPSRVAANQRAHAQLKQQFNALSPQSRSIYRQAREFFKNQRQEMRHALLKNLADTWGGTSVLGNAAYQQLVDAKVPTDIDGIDLKPLQGDADRVKRAAQEIVSLTSVKGPYFPLRRFGKYVVEGNRRGNKIPGTFSKRADAWAKANELRALDPTAQIRTVTNRRPEKGVPGEYQLEIRDRDVRMTDSITEAQEMASEMVAAGYTNRQGKGIKPSLKTEWKGPPGLAATSALISQARKKVVHGSPEDKALSTAFLELLADHALRKAELKRKKRKGASTDMRRAFAERAYAGSWSLADASTAFESRNINRDLRVFARDNGVELGEVVRELELRDNRSLEERSIAEWEAGLSKLGFVWYLASPSYSAVNATQPWLVAAPYLGSRFGQGKALAALMKSYRGVADAAAKEMANVKLGITGQSAENVLDKVRAQLSAEEQAMVDQLTELGVIDATFAQQLYEASKGQKDWGSASAVAERVMNVSRTLPHAVEIMNRVVTARTAYALARDAGQTIEQATEEASEAVYRTQFDYSDHNKPRYFKAFPGARPIMMFKMYAQGIYALLLSSTMGVVKGKDRAANAKLLAGILASHTLAGGVLKGLLIEPVRVLLGLFEFFFEDEDDPWNIDFAVQAFLTDMTSAYVGDLIANGLPRAIGIDLGSRTGLDNLAFMEVREGRSAPETARNWLVAALGPVAGGVDRGFYGYEYFKKGEYQKGLEGLTPKFIRDLSKAQRFLDEGMTDYNGNTITRANEVGPWQALVQAVGFSPSVVGQTYESRVPQQRRETKLRDRRRQLMQQWRRSKDRAAFARENIVPFNRANPDFGITFKQLLQGLQTQREREAQTRGGFYTENPSIREMGRIYPQ